MPSVSSTLKHCYHIVSANAINKEKTEMHERKEVELSLLIDEIVIYIWEMQRIMKKLLKTKRV